VDPRVVRGVVAVADVLPRPVKQDHVVAVGIVRREVGAAPEPRDVPLHQAAEVRVRRGDHRRAWMDHHRHAGGAERAPAPRHLLRQLVGQIARHVRPVDAALPEHVAGLEDAAAPAASPLARPHILAELRGPVGRGQRGGDPLLQLTEPSSRAIGQLHLRGSICLQGSMWPAFRLFRASLILSRIFPSYVVMWLLRRMFPEGAWVRERWRRVLRRNARRLYRGILRLRGVYIKMGQVLSIMGTFLPRAYGEELEGLQDQVPPHPWREVERT